MIRADAIRESERFGDERPRPKFRRELELVPDGDERYFVRDSRTGREFKLGAWEHRVVQLLDGTRQPDDVCRELATVHGIRCARPVIYRFIGQLRGAGLLDDGVVADVRPPRIERRGPLYMVRLACPEDLASRITIWLRNLGHPLTPLGAVALLASAVLLTATHFADMATRVANVWTADGIALALGLGLLSGLVHESAHALAAIWFGARLVSVGVGAYYFRPCLFCEVRGLESLARWKRVVVSGAGVSMDTIQASILVIASFVLPAGMAADVLLLTAFLLGVRVLLNLNPLLKLDGYYVLVDLIGQRDLREAAVRALVDGIRDIGASLWRGGGRAPNPRKLGYMLYALLSMAYIAVLIGTIVVAFEGWLRTTVEGADLIIATLIVLAVARLTDSTLLRRPRHTQVVGSAIAARE